MSRKLLDIKAGDIFGQLTIIEEIKRISQQKRRFLCICTCGKKKEVNLIHLTMGVTKSCGCLLGKWQKKEIRENNPNWKGGRRVVEGGYIEIYMPDHPDSRSNGYIKEHRLVMEQMLGRRLLRCEQPHHKNGDRADNAPENLELWNTSQPSGQRVDDKVSWAKEILKLYGKQ